MEKITVFQFLIAFEQALHDAGVDTIFALQPVPQCHRLINYREQRASLHVVQPAKAERPARLLAQAVFNVVPHAASVVAFSGHLTLPAQDWRSSQLVLLHSREQMEARANELADVMRKAYRPPLAEARTMTPLAAAV